VKDERFSALFSSHHFNIDPTDSHYHKTKGMEALRAEKLHRRQSEMNDISVGVSIFALSFLYSIIECYVISQKWPHTLLLAPLKNTVKL
jgi:hypothetical protein